MESRFKGIELYEYKTDEKTSFYVTDTDENLYLSLESKEIIHLSINTKTGLIVLVGKILGAPKELKLSEWKRNQKNLIKRINICLVRAGRCRQYVLNAGIQSIQENYSSMSYCTIFQHDTFDIGKNMFHTAKMLDHNVILDFKIDKSKIGIHNVSKSTLINLGISGIGFGLGVSGVVAAGTITLPIALSLAVGGSFFFSSTCDFTFEVYGKFDKVGKMDFLEQLTGEMGGLIAKLAGGNPDKWEENSENMYTYITFLYGLNQGRKSLKTLLNPKSYTTVTKTFKDGSYIKLKFVKMKNLKNSSRVDSAFRSLNKGIFLNDLANSASGGKSAYDKTAR